MKGEPYNIIWCAEFSRNNKIKIDLPTYFSNYKYVKVKVKDVFARVGYFAFLYLDCENFNYDRIYQGTTDVRVENYVLNLSRYLEGGNKLSSFRIPYKKDVNMSLDWGIKAGTSFVPLYISFEFTPINCN